MKHLLALAFITLLASCGNGPQKISGKGLALCTDEQNITSILTGAAQNCSQPSSLTAAESEEALHGLFHNEDASGNTATASTRGNTFYTIQNMDIGLSKRFIFAIRGELRFANSANDNGIAIFDNEENIIEAGTISTDGEGNILSIDFGEAGIFTKINEAPYTESEIADLEIEIFENTQQIIERISELLGLPST